MNDIRWNGRKYARRDYKKIQDHRSYWHWRDRRRKKPVDELTLLRRRYMLKLMQFNMALHRQGLRSPFDYEYPRKDQMNKLARELYTRHIEPIEKALWLEDNF